MNEEKRNGCNGLVLGGGGARGCYEIGSWQAFNDCDLHFDCVAGTSIGAIVGAIYVQQTLQPLLHFVYDLKPTNIAEDLFDFPENFNEAFENRHSMMEYLGRYINTGADITPLKQAFEKMFDYTLFHDSPINYACMTFNVSKLKGETFFKDQITRDNALQIILGSASCYPAFPMMEYNGQNYIDGGYEDNLPVDLAVEMGADKVTVIDVHGPGRVKPMPEGVEITYIQPLLPLGNFLDFSSAQGIRSMHIGYLETMKYLSNFCGYIYTFPADQWPRIFVFERYAHLHLERSGFVISLPEAKHVLQYAMNYKPYELHNKYQNEYAIGILCEALAYLFKVNPVKLYDYRYFLQEILKTLQKAQEAAPKFSLQDRRAILKTLVSARKEENVIILHSLLSENMGHLPAYVEPLRKVMDQAYILAWIWYVIELYFSKK